MKRLLLRCFLLIQLLIQCNGNHSALEVMQQRGMSDLTALTMQQTMMEKIPQNEDCHDDSPRAQRDAALAAHFQRCSVDRSYQKTALRKSDTSSRWCRTRLAGRLGWCVCFGMPPPSNRVRFSVLVSSSHHVVSFPMGYGVWCHNCCLSIKKGMSPAIT